MRGGNHKTNLQEKNGDEGDFKREKTEKDKERDGRGLRREKKGKVGRERGEREKIEVEAGRRRYKSGRRSGRFNPRITSRSTAGAVGGAWIGLILVLFPVVSGGQWWFTFRRFFVFR